MHIPVLKNEVVAAFEGCTLSTFVDGTLGAGGHAAAILGKHPEIEHFYGFDQDEMALKMAGEHLADYGNRIHLIHSNFRFLADQIDRPIDGMLIDLGVSSMQLDTGKRGFSFSADAPLDMRMDTSSPLTAAEIVNRWPEEELIALFRDFGELPSYRSITRRILKERERKTIKTTGQLVELLRPVARTPRRKKIHPMTLVFQALRIAVNDELGALEAVLPIAIDKLSSGGRLAIISFHSLEDRIVKRAFAEAAADFIPDPTNPMTGRKDREPIVKKITRRAIKPTKEETDKNPRARSGKLRVVQKL